MEDRTENPYLEKEESKMGESTRARIGGKWGRKRGEGPFFKKLVLNLYRKE